MLQRGRHGIHCGDAVLLRQPVLSDLRRNERRVDDSPLGGTTYSFSFTCETPTSPGPSATLSLSYTATSTVEIVLRYRWRIPVTIWTVDASSVQLTITPVP